MSLLTGKQLAEIMETDVYYAIPYSVVEWLNTLKLNASSRLVLERVISAALQRPSRSDRHLQVRLSLSLISRLTSIKERTVINAMSHLSKLGITEKLDVNNNGTLYQINLSGKIVDMVKKRFKPKTSLAVKEDTPPTQEEGVDLSLEIEQVEQKLSEIKSKQRALSDGLPENFSPIQMLKGDVEFDMASLERLSQLSDIEDKLESKLSELKQEQSTFESSPQSPPDPIKRKSSPRYVRPCDAKALNTRIGKLSFVRSKEQRQVLFAEALWALRFGWYCGYEGSTFQCVNHILKLLKNNDWRTPSQFKPQQVEKLIQYFDIG